MLLNKLIKYYETTLHSIIKQHFLNFNFNVAFRSRIARTPLENFTLQAPYHGGRVQNLQPRMTAVTAYCLE